MAEQIGRDEPTTAPVLRSASTAVMTPEHFDATWRMSKALASSGSFKDIGREEGSKALARILLGADLGMSPTQALLGIDIVKGNPQIRGVALGRMVRNSAKHPTPTGESYDYAVLDRGFTPGEEYAVVALYRRDDADGWPTVEAEDGETFPTILGPVTVAKGKRLPEAVEAFKIDQAKKRKLIKEDGAWQTQPEVMVVWRALSQLVRFYAPDVIGGVPVYTEADELRGGVADAIGASDPVTGPGWGGLTDDERTRVLEVIDAARRKGHAGLSDETVAQRRLHGQPSAVVERFIIEAYEELAAMPEPMDSTAAVDPLTLTFGGQTFTFEDTDDPYAMISAALGQDGAAMVDAARRLDAMAGMQHGLEIERYRAMAVALVREVAQRGSTGEDGL
jgi:hypothetical protein